MSQSHTVTGTLYYIAISGKPHFSLLFFLRAFSSDFSKFPFHVNFMTRLSKSNIKPNQTKQYFCFTETILNLCINLRRNTIFNGEMLTKNKICLSIYSRPVLCLSRIFWSLHLIDFAYFMLTSFLRILSLLCNRGFLLLYLPNDYSLYRAMVLSVNFMVYYLMTWWLC